VPSAVSPRRGTTRDKRDLGAACESVFTRLPAECQDASRRTSRRFSFGLRLRHYASVCQNASSLIGLQPAGESGSSSTAPIRRATNTLGGDTDVPFGDSGDVAGGATDADVDPRGASGSHRKFDAAEGLQDAQLVSGARLHIVPSSEASSRSRVPDGVSSGRQGGNLPGGDGRQECCSGSGREEGEVSDAPTVMASGQRCPLLW
jgi:hypothetical protein